jgi:DNA recombination protein RmuC
VSGAFGSSLVIGLFAVAILLGAAILVVLARLVARLRSPSEGLALLQQQIDSLREEVSRSLTSQANLLDRRIADTTHAVGERLDASGRSIGERLDSVSRTMSDVRQQLGQAQEASQRIFDVGRSIAGLQEILRSPKIRGGLGELFLGELIGQILPEGSFTLQHAFRSGLVVDAVIRAGNHIVPVDAKFPLENFLKLNRATDDREKRSHRRAFITDVRRHIDSIAEKYIRPDEGTFDFALMYIPAENVYYETIVRDEASGEGQAKGLFEHAISRKVIPVSPNSFYAYLQVILLGLRGMRIEETAQQVLSGLATISGDLGRFRETFDLVGKHLGNAARQQETASHQLDSLQGRFETLGASHARDERLPPSPSGEAPPPPSPEHEH